MAIGGAIFSGVMSLGAASKQRRAGRQAQAAAEEGARGIEAETEMNIEQTRRAQAQTMGLAKANIAASGVRFDATKIAAVEFTEGGVEPTAKDPDSPQLAAGDGAMGRAVFGRLFGGGATKTETELEGGEQIAGETEGGSVFTYLKEMKRTFAKDIAWQGKEGRSRARVMRMGGQVAKSQAYAGSMASIGQAAGSFGKAYELYTAGKAPKGKT